MSGTAPVLIVCDHPSLHRGFSVVGERIAGHLYRHEGMPVRFIGRYPPDSEWRGPGYPVHSLHAEAGYTEHDDRDPSLEDAFEAWLPRAGGRATVLCIGTWKDLRVTRNALEERGLRESVRLVGYMPVDCAPLPVQFADFARDYDILVPYSPFAHAALDDCFRRAQEAPSMIAAPIGHGVDTGVFRPLDAQARAAARRTYFDVDDRTLLLGYFGRNSGHKRPDLVLRLFQMFATGAYVVCARCGATTGDALEPDGTPGPAAERCAACDGADLRPGRGRDDCLLYLHTDLHAEEAERVIPQARDLVHIAGRYGIGDRLRYLPDIRIGHGVSATELAARMGACDVHVLPYTCAGWELTVLETGACGVPNVITGIASPPGYAAPFSRVIPAAVDLLESEARCLMDLDLALRALIELADAPAERARLGAAGVEVARGLDWRRVGGEWAGLLRP